MDAMPVVLDISSDDDPCLEALSDNLDWIKDFLGVTDEEVDDSDVVIVGEVKANPKKNPETVKDREDDCVVLDGDPDKSISAGEETDDGSDEVVVVGQKGQIACRDYPHPRHHCAEFPFASTPHEKHCHQCHCYVCDSLAPCLYWGTGLSKSDHCHATDKVEIWKVLRRDLKHGSNVPSSTFKPIPHSNYDLVNQNVLVAPNSTLQNQISGLISTPPYPPLPNFIPQNKFSMAPTTCDLSRLNTSSVGSSTFSLHAPHPVNIGQNQVPGGMLSRSRFQYPLIQNPAFHGNTRRDPVHVTHTGSGLGPSSAMLKRSGTNWIARRFGSSAYTLGNTHLNTTTQNERNTPSGTSNGYYSSQWSGLQACTSTSFYESTPHPKLLGMNRVPPRSFTYNPPVIQSNNGQEFYPLGNRYQGVHPSNSGFQSINQHHDGGEFQNVNRHQDDGGFQNVNQQEDGSGFHNISQNQHPVDNGFPSGSQRWNQYHEGGEFLGNHLLENQHQEGGEFQSIIREDNQYQIFPCDTYQTESVCMRGQNISQLGNLTQNANQLISDQEIQSQNLQNTDYSADLFRCVHNSIQVNYPSTESFQVQDKVGCRSEPTSVSESISPYSSNSIDLELEKWLSDSQTTLMSPEPEQLDAGLLFCNTSYSGEM